MDYDSEPEERPRRRTASGLILVLAALVGWLSLADGPVWAMATATAREALFTYDDHTLAPVAEHVLEPTVVSVAEASAAPNGFPRALDTDRGSSTTPPAPSNATEAGTDLVRYDPGWASRQLLGQNTPGSVGYAVTPGGRTVTAHAADVIANGGRGRPPTSLTTVDEILDTGTSVRWNPINDTVRVTQPGLPGRPFVAVDDATGNHIVTVMVPK